MPISEAVLIPVRWVPDISAVLPGEQDFFDRLVVKGNTRAARLTETGFTLTSTRETTVGKIVYRADLYVNEHGVEQSTEAGLEGLLAGRTTLR